MEAFSISDSTSNICSDNETGSQLPVTNDVYSTSRVYASCKSSLRIIGLNEDNEKPGKKKL